MESISNAAQNEPQSFEISQWFSSVLNRIDNIQIHQRYLIKWRNLALKLKQANRLARINYVHHKYRQKKCSRSSKSNWLLFYSKLWHRRKKKLFNIAKNQLLDAKQKAEDLRRAKKILMISETESEDYDNDNSNPHTDSDSNQNELTFDRYADLTPNAKKWISMSQRFLSQTKYIEMNQAYQDYLNDLKFQKIERRNIWQEMAHTLIWNIQKRNIKIRSKKLKRARENWNYFYSNCLLAFKLKHIKDVYYMWNSRSLKTDSQIRRCWHRFIFSLKFKQNILRIVRESSALSTLTNFFRYIILIRRSAAVANYFPIRYVASIRSMVKKSTYDSADKIRKFASMKVTCDNDTFAFNWSNCIAEAFSNVASHQVGPPDSIEQRKVKVKQKQKANKKVSTNQNNQTTVQTVQVKTSDNSQQQNDQENPEYPIKIIKITRNFDPNEEESDREVLPYLSESDGNSDSGSDKPKGPKPHDNKYKGIDNDTESIMEVRNSKDEQTIIIQSSKKKPKADKGISIEINPSRSQSTGSIEEIANNENTSDSNNDKSNKNLNIDFSASQDKKPIKKKRKKQKELYAPIVIPKGRKTLSPIKKKRSSKLHNDDVSNPTISDILNIVGIESSLELLDEGTSSDNSNSSDIHFRFDDDSSDPIAEPFKDLVVDLININTSEEERRIRQSLLEASQASSNPPNEEEEDLKLPNLKEEKKIDLLEPSHNNIINDEPISTSPSYNSNSESTKEKDFTENKSNGIDADQILVEEEEEDDDIISGKSVKDAKMDLIKDIELKKEEEDLAGLIEEEEEDKSCQFNFESDKNDSKNSSKIKVKSNSLNEQKSVEGPSDSYISDRDVDAAMHEYSSEETK